MQHMKISALKREDACRHGGHSPGGEQESIGLVLLVEKSTAWFIEHNLSYLQQVLDRSLNTLELSGFLLNCGQAYHTFVNTEMLISSQWEISYKMY